MHKREFLRTLGGSTLGFVLSPSLIERFAATPAEVLAQDDAQWAQLRGGYDLPAGYVHLENGYYSMMSKRVLQAYKGHIDRLNQQSSRFLRSEAAPAARERVRRNLASLAGCQTEELIVTRNTTESLDTVISGQNWAEGDEAVYATSEYGAMIDQLALMAKRHRITPVPIELPLHPTSDEQIVEMYAAAITPKTKFLLVSHVVNITGQVLPVQKIAEMAVAKNVRVAVDGAHAFAQLDFKIPDIGADYYAASLHKWLGAPIGAGILYVKRDRIADLWPLYADANFPDDDIRKLNHTGTHPIATELAIEDAIQQHTQIGVAKKQARLRFLQEHWTKQVRATPRITLHTPEDPARCCAIATVAVEGMTPTDLHTQLLNQHQLWTVAIDRPAAGVQGVRVTPHLFTTTAELDILVRALQSLAA